MVVGMVIKNKVIEGEYGVNITGVTFVKCKFINGESYAKFKDCTFTNCIFSNYELQNKFKRCSFVNCKFNDVNFNCDLIRVSFNGGTVNGCDFNSTLALVYTYDVKFTDCKFIINGGIFDNGSTFKNCKGMLYKYEQVTILEDGIIDFNG